MVKGQEKDHKFQTKVLYNHIIGKIIFFSSKYFNFLARYFNLAFNEYYQRVILGMSGAKILTVIRRKFQDPVITTVETNLAWRLLRLQKTRAWYVYLSRH